MGVISLDKKDEKIEKVVENENEIIYLNKTIKLKLKGYKKNDHELIKLNESVEVGMKIVDVLEKIKIKSNKEIANIIKAEKPDIESIRNKINDNVNNQISIKKKDVVKNNVLNTLFLSNKIEIPRSLVLYKKSLEINKNTSEKDLKKNIAIEILIKEIIKKEKISLKKMEVENRLNEIYKILFKYLRLLQLNQLNKLYILTEMSAKSTT